MKSRALRTQPDPVADLEQLTFGAMNLWIHEDILDGLDRWDHLRSSTASVLQRLAAHRRTSVVKGCGNVNRGWRRSPLGGRGGMQFYLWWTVQGNVQAGGVDGLKPRDILVRAIRHHDDHAPLTAGDGDDYTHGDPPQFIDDDIGSPWTADQLEFVNHDDPVRVVQGQPGSGKTTALWKAIEARAGQRVLYLTWSRLLTEHAREHLTTFAPRDVEVVARDFLTFLGELRGEDVVRQPASVSRARFKDAVARTRLRTKDLTPWPGREDALFAEVRAELFGMALQGQQRALPDSGLVRLADRAYLDRRMNALDPRAMSSVLKIVNAIEPGTLAGIFPELAAAASALDRLRNSAVSEELGDFDRIVVDEAQDLTMLELEVVVEHVRCVARSRGNAPWLLLAGDEGQTVRPSGFEWGPVSDLLANAISAPRSFRLEGNQRCPTRIANVIDRASEQYRHISKGQRPGGQQRESGGRDLDAQIFHVAVPSHQEAESLLRQLQELDDIAIVSPELDAPAWVPSSLRDVVLTSAEAKGLEYQNVCVLDPGAFLASLEESLRRRRRRGEGEKLEEHIRRTAIDRLRVALSRPTETLAFVDVEGDDAARALSLKLLGDPVRFEPADLVEHLTNTDATPEERVSRRIDEASNLIDESPALAWLRAEQAVMLLGDANLPNGVADSDLRDQARTTLLGTAARLLVDGLPDGLTRRTVVDTASKAFVDASAPDAHPERLLIGRNALDRLAAWCASKNRAAAPPFDLLNAVIALHDAQWLRAALPPVRQTLHSAIKRQADAPTRAPQFDGDVEGWLAITDFPGDAAAEARGLRTRAVATLIEHDTDAAERVLAKVVPEDTQLIARLRLAQGRFEDAADAFERAELPADALRAWREAGRWDRAVRLATGKDLADLEWLVQLEQAAAQRPGRIGARLTEREKQRLEALATAIGQDAGAKAAAKPPPKSARGKPRSTKPLVVRVQAQLPPIRGKYAPLHQHLLSLRSDVWNATFAEIETVIGKPLPASAHQYTHWWTNSYIPSQSKAWMEAGFRTSDVDLAAQTVTFRRTRGNRQPPSRPSRMAYSHV